MKGRSLERPFFMVALARLCHLCRMRWMLLTAAALVLTGCSNDDQYVWPRSADYMEDGGILVFSKTTDWRHETGIPAATRFLAEFAEDEGLAIHSTEDSRVFHKDVLSRFSVVVFNSATGNGLTRKQEKAFEKWLEAGGGYVGIHGAGDASQAKWSWYQSELIGATFVGHTMVPHIQEAELVQLTSGHEVTEGLPKTFKLKDEWYSFDTQPQDDFTLLLGLRESSYTLNAGGVWPDEDLVMGAEPIQHPVVWARCVGKGRSVYSALGHTAEAYDAEEHQRLIGNAVRWASGAGDTLAKEC